MPRRPAAIRLCSRMALLAYGYAFGEAEPVRAMAALRRGLVIAQDSGNRGNQSHTGNELVPT